jgi:anti-sigma factor RsiW
MHPSEEQLNEYLDNESINRIQIESHLASCDECAARLTTLQHLFAEIESLPEAELSRSLAAPFLRTRSLPAQLPAWLPLTVTLQAAIALVSLIVAAPFLIQLLPAIETPSLSKMLIQLQTQWTAWLDLLSQIHMPSLPAFSFELSSLYLMATLVVVSMLWLVGNGLLLRNQIKY